MKIKMRLSLSKKSVIFSISWQKKNFWSEIKTNASFFFTQKFGEIALADVSLIKILIFVTD